MCSDFEKVCYRPRDPVSNLEAAFAVRIAYTKDSAVEGATDTSEGCVGKFFGVNCFTHGACTFFGSIVTLNLSLFNLTSTKVFIIFPGAWGTADYGRNFSNLDWPDLCKSVEFFVGFAFFRVLCMLRARLR